MSLSELFKPWLGSCGACAAPWPNVALVLQYLQALRVSPTLSSKRKVIQSKKKYFILLLNAAAIVVAAEIWARPVTILSASRQHRAGRCALQSYLLGLLAKIKCSICSYQLNLWYVAHGVT